MQYEKYEEMCCRLAVKGSRDDYARFVESMLLVGGMPGVVNRAYFEVVQSTTLFWELLDEDSRPTLTLYSSVLNGYMLAEVEFCDRAYTINLRMNEQAATQWYYEFAYQHDGWLLPKVPERFDSVIVQKLVKSMARG